MEINKFTIHYIIFILASKFNFLFFHTSAHRFKTLPEITVTNAWFTFTFSEFTKETKKINSLW